MKRGSILFLQIVIVLIGIGALTWMLWEPHLEGVNANATFFQVYLDLFIAYAYIASIAFFVGLYQAFRLLGYVGQNKPFSPPSVKALRTITYCALTLIAFIVPPLAYLFIVRPGDDIAGGVAMGLFIFFVSVVVAAVAYVCEGILQKAVDMK